MSVTQNGVRFSVHNGRKARFWEDSWVDREKLVGWAPPNLTEIERNRVVADYWQHGRGWKWDIIGDRIPEEVRSRMDIMEIKDDELDDDEAYWTMEDSGKFTVSSAYQHINSGNIVLQDKGWSTLWAVKAPNRMKAFMWLVRHEKILCN